MSEDLIKNWLRALEERYFATLTPAETARALRALSSCYVERRAKIAHGGALDTTGKRAAFALFYAPLHLIVTREIIRRLQAAVDVNEVVDLGCGTGAAGAAWALEAGRCRLVGCDRHPWAVEEAVWTYRTLRLDGRAIRTPIERFKIAGTRGSAILAAYSINELSDSARAPMLDRLVSAHARGARILVVEPIARRHLSWWDDWRQAFESAGGLATEWTLSIELPDTQRQLAHAAGLQPRQLSARTLWLP